MAIECAPGKHPRTNWPPLALAGLLAGGLPAAGCEPGALLIVQAASAQPGDTTSGTIVLVQSEGGDTLGVRTRGCLHTRAGTDTPSDVSCIPVPRDLNEVYFSLLSAGGECVVHAELYRGSAASNAGSDGGTVRPTPDPSFLVCPGSGGKVAEREVPISRSTFTTPDAGADASTESSDAGVEPAASADGATDDNVSNDAPGVDAEGN